MWLWVHHTMHVNFIDLQVSLIISKIHKSSTKQYQAPVFEHRKSRAIKRPAITVLLWCYLGIFTPKKSFAKNNTNSDLFSGFVLFAYGGGNRAHASARCGTHLRAVITTQTKEKPYCLVGFRGVGGGNRARTCDLTDVNRVL